jgi:hypothetical protein
MLETRGIVVLFVEGQPRDGVLRGVQPLGHEGGLAIAGGGADDGDFSMPRVQSAIKMLDEVWSRQG